MTPGPIEETGKVATAVIESLKTSPAMLAILIFNILLLALVYFGGREIRSANAGIISTLLADQKAMVEMISKCVVPSPPTL